MRAPLQCGGGGHELTFSPVYVRGFSKPFAAYSVNEPNTLGDMDPPVFIYASPAFCHVTGFDLVRHPQRSGCLLFRSMSLDLT